MPTLTTLVTFGFGNELGDPVAGLIADAAGDLFGTTIVGGTISGSGANNYGAVFEIANTSSGYASVPTTIFASFNQTNGQTPVAGLIADAAGDLFGTTSVGGDLSVGGDGGGTVFEIAKTASGYASTPTTLVSFNGTNGAHPDASLHRRRRRGSVRHDGAGGTTLGSPIKALARCSRSPRPTAATPARQPHWPASTAPTGHVHQAGLIADAAGDLFGTTAYGGANGDGTVFEIAKTAGGYATTPTTLVSFNGTNGAYPYAGLIADAAGDLFGTT